MANINIEFWSGYRPGAAEREELALSDLLESNTFITTVINSITGVPIPDGTRLMRVVTDQLVSIQFHDGVGNLLDPAFWVDGESPPIYCRQHSAVTLSDPVPASSTAEESMTGTDAVLIQTGEAVLQSIGVDASAGLVYLYDAANTGGAVSGNLIGIVSSTLPLPAPLPIVDGLVVKPAAAIIGSALIAVTSIVL